MKRTFTAILLGLALSLSMTACTGKAPAPAESSAAPESTAQAAESEEQEPAAEEAPAEVTITHELGETTLKTNPEKVVVLDYGALDALDFAGIEIAGLGKTASLPEHLSKYADEKYAATGSLHEPDFEAINELQPDLIIIGARASSAYEELQKIAPTILFTMPTSGYMDTFKSNLSLLSQVFPSKADLFAEQAANVETKAADILKTVQEKGYTALTLMVNDGEISVFGKGSRFAVIYDDFGFTVIDEGIDQSTHGQSATYEYIAQQNPDYLFVIDRSAATGAQGTTGAQAVLDNELIAATKAAQDGHIVYLNSTNWYVVSGGITSTLAMAEEVGASVA